MKIYLLRHGQTVMNQSHVLQGQTNSDLNKKGVEQAKDVGERIRQMGLHFDRIYCSPLHRTVQTCYYATGMEEDQIILDDRLKEIDLGELEGVRFDSIEKELRDAFMRKPFDYDAPMGGETIQNVVDRAQNFLEDLKKTENDDTVLIVSHGGAIHGLLFCMTSKPKDAFWLPMIENCALIETELKDGEFVVEEKYRKLDLSGINSPI